MVTDNQIPQWLNLTDKKIEVIDHTEIIDAKYLPVFNSSVIEMNIYKIPFQMVLYMFFFQHSAV